MASFSTVSVKNPQSFDQTLWQAAEEYIKPLSTSNKLFEITLPSSTSAFLTVSEQITPDTKSKASYIITALKVISYVLVVPVIFAAAICIRYRSEYGISDLTSETETNEAKISKTSMDKDIITVQGPKKSDFVDKCEEKLCEKDAWLNGVTISSYLHRFSYKALSDNKPFTLARSYAPSEFKAIFKKTIVNGARGVPVTMKTVPPKEGRLAVSLNIKANHFTGLFIDFDKKAIFYYDPFGHDSCPYDMDELTKTFFPDGNVTITKPFDGKHHQRYAADDAHTLDHNNCGRYVLKFFETMISADDPAAAYQSFIAEDIDSDIIYVYAQDIAQSYKQSNIIRPPYTPGDIQSDDPVAFCDLTEDEDNATFTNVKPTPTSSKDAEDTSTEDKEVIIVE